MIAGMKRRRAQMWARRHVFALSALDNLLTAVAVELLGFVVGLAIGVVITVIIFEVEHYRRGSKIGMEIHQAEEIVRSLFHTDGRPRYTETEYPENPDMDRTC